MREAVFSPRERSPGLYPTLWPTDHADTERTQCVTGAGLPADFDPSKAEIRQNTDLHYPVFMYTRDEGELFIYGRGKMVGKTSYIAKVDPVTLAVKQKFELPFAIYVGGLLMHANGDVFAVHSSTLYRFKGGDLDQVERRTLPQINGPLTCYNGVTVASSGHLLIKGWAIDVRDKEVLAAPVALGVGVALVSLFAAMGLGPAFIPLGLLPTVGLLTLLVQGIRHGLRLAPFIEGDTTGVVLSVDPETLEVTDTLSPPERLGFARMTVTQSAGSGGEGAAAEDLLFIPGGTRLFCWHLKGGRFLEARRFTETYRDPADGSYSGCGPTVLGDHVYFTDNVAPVNLSADSFRLFKKDLVGDEPFGFTQLSRGQPGFNFWSNASSPAEGLLISWDTLGAWVEARHAPSMELAWTAESRCPDCVVVVEDRDHVYTAHYSKEMSLKDYLTAFGPRARASGNEKALRVLSLSTGEVKFEVPLGQTAPCMSMILPGRHNDVFMATRDALVRISAPA